MMTMALNLSPLTFDGEPGIHLNPEAVRPEIRARRHKVHAILVILIPDEVVPLGPPAELVLQTADGAL